MKNSRLLSILFVVIYFVCGFTTMAQAQTSITTSQLFTISDDITQIEVPEGITIEFKTTLSKRITVETKVEANTKFAVLEFLKNNFYFHITAKVDENLGKISMFLPKLELAKNTVIQGKQIELNLKLIVYLPENMLLSAKG